VTEDIRPGDVLCTRNENGKAAKVIRFGAALLGKPNVVNHVAIYMGVSEDGKDRVIEANPGGVGWKDAHAYMRDNWTMDNREQPKTLEQREQIIEAAKAMLGTPYDWFGIGQNAMEAIRAPDLYRSDAWKDVDTPEQVVCSSLADWVYGEVGLANPGKTDHGDRITTPGDWAEFILAKAWEKPRNQSPGSDPPDAGGVAPPSTA
jgi:cell wall-associated NlpC family hydrolase